MKIIYISNLSTNIAAGLNWSVPATVNAQSHFDDVLWINLTNVTMDHWKKVSSFHNISDFKDLELCNFPEPFDSPDLVVFEGFYHIKDPLFAKKLKKRGIPYIIVPRSALTKQAQNSGILKMLKKTIANLFIFKRYVKDALAIQYLTSAEQKDSEQKWNKNSIIIPNGFDCTDKYKESFSKEGLKAVFIGRLDCYQKGLDELLKACVIKKDLFECNNVKIDLYGPHRYDHEKIAEYIKHNQIDQIVYLHDEVSGEEKEQILLNSDVFLLPSRFEGHPMSLIEALNYGLPSLVSKGSNMLDEVIKHDAGWKCECNAQSIASALEHILKNKIELVNKSNNALQLGRMYDWHSIAKSFHEDVCKLLNYQSNNNKLLREK